MCKVFSDNVIGFCTLILSRGKFQIIAKKLFLEIKIAVKINFCETQWNESLIKTI